jgi:hypothetical protein
MWATAGRSRRGIGESISGRLGLVGWILLFVPLVDSSACAKGNAYSRPTSGDHLLMWYLRDFSSEEETSSWRLPSSIVERFDWVRVGRSESDFHSWFFVSVCWVPTYVYFRYVDIFDAFEQTGPYSGSHRYCRSYPLSSIPCHSLKNDIESDEHCHFPGRQRKCRFKL